MKLLPTLLICLCIAANAFAQPHLLRVRANATNSSTSLILDAAPTARGNGHIVIADWTAAGPHVWRSLLKFDMASIPTSSVVVDSAFLSLYANLNSPSGYTGQPTYGTDNASTIYRITSTWDTSTVCWNVQPTYTNADSVQLSQSTCDTQSYTHLNITNMVRSMITSGRYGFFMKHNQETTYYNSMIFCGSYDYQTDSSKTPLLQVYYRNTVEVENVNTKTTECILAPNPASNGVLSVCINNITSVEELSATIVDLTGKACMTAELSQGAATSITASIDIAELAHGIYLLKIIGNQGTRLTKQFVIR